MTPFLAQIKEIWNRLPTSGRIASVGAGVATLALLGAVIYYGSQPEYGVLFSNLKAEDAQTIVEKLKAENVPYSLSNNGTTIQVPIDRIAEIRLQTAGTGVLSGGHVGFDLFDKTNFGATDFAQQVNYRRAIEGELAKTLEGVDEIEQARVHITPKKESVFSEKEEGAKASVMLRVRQGKELSSERTEAVVSLIASAVEGLDPSNVSVMDTNGRLLNEGNGHGKSGATSDAGTFHAQLEARQKLESETTARVISFLEPVVGEGRVRANVSADVDFSQVEQTEEKYNPQSQVVRSQQNSQESRNSGSPNSLAPAPSGVAGSRSNDPTTPAPAQNNQARTGEQRTSNTINYEIDRTVKKTVGSGGHINRLTVSVVVDSKTVNGVEVARTPDELQKIQNLVAAAIGTNEQRGDSVVVQTMPFDKPQVEPAASASFLDRNKQFIPNAIKYGALIIVALLLLLFVVRPARKALKLAFAPPSQQHLLPESTDETFENGQRLGDTARINELEGGQLMTVAELESQMHTGLVHTSVSKDAQRAENLKKMVAEQTFNNPEIVVNTLRGWLKEA